MEKGMIWGISRIKWNFRGLKEYRNKLFKRKIKKNKEIKEKLEKKLEIVIPRPREYSKL